MINHVRKRRSGITEGDANCGTLEKGVLLFSIPANETRAITFQMSDLVATTASVLDGQGKIAYPTFSLTWHLTFGGKSTWKWSYLVAETDKDWSSWTTAEQAKRWRRSVKLEKVTTGGYKFRLTLSAVKKTDFANFIMAPYGGSGYHAQDYYYIRICRT